MSLDLSRVAAQAGEMVSRLKTSARERQKHLEYARETLLKSAGDWPALQKKIDASHTTWLVAGLAEKPDQTYPSMPIPPDFTILATDGSHIDVDRHRGTRCYLMNIGRVSLTYGRYPDAMLESHPTLCSDDKEMVLTSAAGREQPLQGNLLGIQRAVAEGQHLAEMASQLPPDTPAIALLDGSLILWGLEAYPDFVTEELLGKGFLRHLDTVHRLSRERELALASYISFTRSVDVVNALRVAVCPHQPVDCDRFCPPGKEKACEAVAGVQDRELLYSILQPGERSAVFQSRSSIVTRYYGVHQVYFFYLRVEDEVARVEVPQWVITDSQRLDLVHTLALDQARRGSGYPVALSEAHEQAVITGEDRENFWQLVESLMVEEKLPTLTSAKSQSKKMRWV